MLSVFFMSNILETRYAGRRMREIWTPERKYRSWRDVWVAVAETRMELGADVTPEQVADLKEHRDTIDYARALEIEKITKHDVVAHARHYADVCPIGGPIVHDPLTSDNVTSPAEARQIKDSLYIAREETAAVIDRVGEKAKEHKDLACVAYTHFQSAQPTTMGKRFAVWGQGFSEALQTLEYRDRTFKWGGIRGATGTQETLMRLFHGNEELIAEFERRVGEKLGLQGVEGERRFGEAYAVTGQTPPRSGDYQIVSALAEVGIAAQKFGTDLRLLWHTHQVGEPFGTEQVGSSAMPYKRNASRSERMCSLSRPLYAYTNELANLAGQQWLERSLDDSAERRIVLPDAFLDTDAVLQLAMFVAEGLQVYPGPIGRELREHLTFASTENIVAAATAKGVPRDTAHRIVRGHSQVVQQNLLSDPDAKNDLIDRLVAEERLGLTGEEIGRIINDTRRYTGRASQQVDGFLLNVVEPIRKRYPHAREIVPEVEV